MTMGNASRGRSQQTKGVAESTLRVKAKLSHRKLDPQALLVPEQMQARLQVGLCPYCDRGPFSNIAMHTSSAHGMGPRELRDAAGLPYNHVLTSPELHAANVKHGRQRDMEKMRSKKTAGKPRKLSEAARKLNAAKLADVRNLAMVAAAEAAKAAAAERLKVAEPLIRQAVAAGLPLKDLAPQLGVSAAVVGRYARRLGIPDGRTLPGAAASRSPKTGGTVG